ncbi:MAG: PTS sugar transporter subunit IIA [Spirochaetes bacterium]|nr:MAG: PTS sugar transporter subunit IIA [Spirochaetota bacterium]
MTQLSDYSSPAYIRKLKARNKFKAIEELARSFQGSAVCEDLEELVVALIEREKIMSTGIGFGIAIPHAKIASVNQVAFAIGVSKQGIDFESIDGHPVHIIILVAAGEKQHKDYLKLLSKIMSVLKQEGARNRLIESASSEDVLRIFEIPVDA